MGAEFRGLPGLPPALAAPFKGCAFARRRCRPGDAHACSLARPSLEQVDGHVVVACRSSNRERPQHDPVTGSQSRKSNEPLQERATWQVHLYRGRRVDRTVPGRSLASSANPATWKIDAQPHHRVGLEKATSGRVVATLDGIDLSTLSGAELRKSRRALQYVFQDPRP